MSQRRTIRYLMSQTNVDAISTADVTVAVNSNRSKHELQDISSVTSHIPYSTVRRSTMHLILRNSFLSPVPRLERLVSTLRPSKTTRKQPGLSIRRIRSHESEFEGPQLQPLDDSSPGGLGGTSEEVYGPFAILLVGFRVTEVSLFRQMLSDLGAEDIQLLSCHKDALQESLSTVFSRNDPVVEDPPLGVRRTVFLSGMYASEVNEVISVYKSSGLPRAVFAALVPKNGDKKIADLVAEVYDDHQYMLMKLKNKTTKG